MTWDIHHSESTACVSDAYIARMQGNTQLAEDLYRQAANEEAEAFKYLPLEKARTRGITAISAVVLWHKGHDFEKAKQFAQYVLTECDLPQFAVATLGSMGYKQPV